MRFYVARDAREASLTDGTALTRGQFIDLDPEQRRDENTRRLIAEGQLLGATRKSEAEAEQITEEENK